MGKRTKADDGPGGLVIVDKPAGWTSHDVVGRVRRLARTRRVGHAGTLDPMATGVLVVGVEKTTRLLGHLALTRKTYETTIRLGQSTVTDDAEGEVTDSADAADVSDDMIRGAIPSFTGPIMQRPSAVSAIKVDGVRSYKRVREGEAVELAERPVTVYRFEVHAIRRQGPLVDVDATVECSSGTYIRALARDLGAVLGVGGHLTMLRRTAVGPYGLDLARPLPELTELVDGGGELPVVPLDAAARAAFPARDISAEEAGMVAHGGFLAASGRSGEPVAVFGPDGRFLALYEDLPGGKKAKPVAVFI
ncbi:tRNA pseudouridine(55) synthase TruB [Catenulispora sp. NF23]|uniref:tRNA pseudouridine(55) synthase TruB n=1 Tax=Catenulispora pinistramenti TaxID=2705254 RepID=UPI001BACC1BC|nr:tRNA pseudouridine(55) synthase TruB [Catenulispora pinistramenti]MBS2532350.1 tRNA pseudouridine(55) synthase TruB [Catenulispora pinistramenti]